MIDSYTTQVTTIIIHMLSYKKTALHDWLKDIEFLQKLRCKDEMPKM